MSLEARTAGGHEVAGRGRRRGAPRVPGDCEDAGRGRPAACRARRDARAGGMPDARHRARHSLPRALRARTASILRERLSCDRCRHRIVPAHGAGGSRGVDRGRRAPAPTCPAGGRGRAAARDPDRARRAWGSPPSTTSSSSSPTSGWGCCSSSPAMRSTSIASAGRPLTLGAVGLGPCRSPSPTAIGGMLAAAGVVLSLLYTGSAMATTAIGTLIPVLRDSRRAAAPGSAPTCWRPAPSASSGRSSCSPSSSRRTHPLHEAAILIALHRPGAWLIARCPRCARPGAAGRCSSARSRRAASWRCGSPSVLVFSLVALASELGLDLLLGGFVAGMITRARAARGGRRHPAPPSRRPP